MIKKIAITGPESTGKSTLTKQLADHYHTFWIKEYAREYIDLLDRPYNQKDILKIAKEQRKRWLEFEKKHDGILFSDTELIVTKIWSEIKYQHCHPWILEEIKKQDFDLYLLCDIDLPWEDDPQREHPNLREHLFDRYKTELEKRKLNFRIISGNHVERFNNALEFVEALM